MVTHDPVAARYADRVVFLADGRIVDEMAQPTPTPCSTASRASTAPSGGSAVSSIGTSP